MITIAIDGPSASGKGTIARKLAKHLNFAYLDTGLLYRAVGMSVLHLGGDLSDANLAERQARMLDGHTIDQMTEKLDLRSDQASTAASQVAAFPAVRQALLDFQRNFCQNPPDGKGGAVLDGRDIGTVIAPHATVKIFVTASADARAERRFKELKGRGEQVMLADVVRDMLTRDARDRDRVIAPTKPALDAIILDTTTLTAEEALQAVVSIVEKKGL